MDSRGFQLKQYLFKLFGISSEKKSPSPEAIRLAKEYPNAWVYELLPEYRGKENVPIEGILGAWKVDAHGNIIGDYIPKERFSEL